MNRRQTSLTLAILAACGASLLVCVSCDEQAATTSDASADAIDGLAPDADSPDGRELPDLVATDGGDLVDGTMMDLASDSNVGPDGDDTADQSETLDSVDTTDRDMADGDTTDGDVMGGCTSHCLEWEERNNAQTRQGALQGQGIARDSNGDLYVVGRGDELVGPALTLLKYDTTGTLIWSYSRSDGINTAGYGVAVDPQTDDVIVVGSTDGAPVEALVVRLDGTGNVLWDYQSRFGLDSASASSVAVSLNGTIAVSGVGTEMGNQDAIVFALDSNGNETWSARWGATLSDHFRSVDVDSNGVVYAGGHTGLGVQSDVLVAKYDATGDEVWVRTWDAGFSEKDIAYGIAYHDTGLYLAGSSHNGNNGDDFTTLKMTHDGLPVWDRGHHSVRFSEARAIAVDDDGVYAVGGALEPDGFDLAAVRYDHDGVEIWAEHSAVSTGYDQAFGIVTGGSANAHVAGVTNPGINELVVAALDLANGTWGATWSRPGTEYIDEDGRSVVVDPVNGDIYVGSSTQVGPATLAKYESGGTLLYESTPNVQAEILAPAPHGLWAPKAAGTVNLAALDPDGNTLAEHPGSITFLVDTIAVASNGDVIMAGLQLDPTLFLTYPAATRFDSDGTELWASVFTSANMDFVHAITTDDQGNTYVIGENQLSGFVYEMAVVKIDGAGQLVWERRLGDSGGESAFARGAVVDSAGDVIVAGSMGWDIAFWKLDPDGQEVWVQTYDLADELSADALTWTPQGTLLIAGARWPAGMSAQSAAWLAEFDADGNFIDEWSRSASTRESMAAVAIHPDGYVQVGTTLAQPVTQTLIMKWIP